LGGMIAEKKEQSFFNNLIWFYPYKWHIIKDSMPK
jgi:hypothetical protein